MWFFRSDAIAGKPAPTGFVWAVKTQTPASWAGVCGVACCPYTEAMIAFSVALGRITLLTLSASAW